MSAAQLTAPADGPQLCLCMCVAPSSVTYMCSFRWVRVVVSSIIYACVCVCVCYTDSSLSLQVISWLRRERQIEEGKKKKKEILAEREIKTDRGVAAAITQRSEMTINMYMLLRDVCLCRWHTVIFSEIFSPSACRHFFLSQLVLLVLLPFFYWLFKDLRRVYFLFLPK